ncbi:MAG: hypothetical protein R3A48_00180 [Polyangiales bacterium]
MIRTRAFSFAAALCLTACGTAATPVATDASAQDAPSLVDAQLDASADVADVAVVTDAKLTSDAPPADVVRIPEPVAGPTTCNPLAFSADCLPPFPSDLLTVADPSTPTRRRLAIPRDALLAPMGTRAIEVAPFNRADGWPTSIPVLLNLGVALRAEDLADIRHPERSVDPASPIGLFELDTGRRVPFLSEMDANARDVARAAVIVRPLEPLRFGSRYVLAVRSAARTTTGAPLPTSPGFVALRDNTPATDPRLEAARPRYEEAFAMLARNGFSRNEIQFALEWTTASRQHVLGPILAMRQEVFRRAAMADGIPFTIARVEESPNPNVARIVYGTFTPPNYLDADDQLVFNADGTAALQPDPPSYPFTMIVPAVARTATAPMPLTVFGHGVFGRGEDYLTGNIGRDRIQPLAQELGSAVIATDWIGLSGGDLNRLIQQVVPNINRVTLVTDRLLQSVVNNLALTELAVGALSRDMRVRYATPELIDPTRVNYYGVSLGGIQGSSLFSVSRHIRRAVVAVPGGSWSNLLPRSTVYGPIKTFIDARYPDPLLQAQFIALLQGRFDHTDGVNLATLAFREPLDDAPSGRRLILQEAIGDCQVPNFASRILSRAFGARQLNPSTEVVFGLTPTMSPAEGPAALAQIALPDHLARYTPPDTNTIPSMDNGTHSDSVSTETAYNQLRALFRDGTITQTCTGACDPD